MKLSIKAAALSAGIIWGGGLFFYVIWTMIIGGPSDIITFLSNYYLGLKISFSGSIIGLLWGFLDAAIGGALFAWLYNKFI